MATYAIGDVQGCFDALMRLMDTIDYQPGRDTLWFAGDLVNRGSQSLETLRWISQQPNVKVVLGNHDLHLIAVAHGHAASKGKDTIDSILTAPDRHELIEWLQQQPLLVNEGDWWMSHAGYYPLWTLDHALDYAKEVENCLRGPEADKFLSVMYGNKPEHWQDNLEGMDRLRFITNAFTRMRFIGPQGRLDMSAKEGLDHAPSDYMPWFRDVGVEDQLQNQHWVFGHWAALEGHTGIENIHAVDTGCVWGGQLTALRLDDLKRLCVPAH